MLSLFPYLAVFRHQNQQDQYNSFPGFFPVMGSAGLLLKPMVNPIHAGKSPVNPRQSCLTRLDSIRIILLVPALAVRHGGISSVG